MKNKSIINKIFGVHLTALIVLSLFLCHIFLINLATFNISHTEKISEEIMLTQAIISELEFDFIQTNREIANLSPQDFDLIHSVKDSDKIFVKRQVDNRLTLNER
jgi:hypothetical protein